MMLLGQFSIQAFHSIENYLYDAIRRGTIGTIAFQEARTYMSCTSSTSNLMAECGKSQLASFHTLVRSRQP